MSTLTEVTKQAMDLPTEDRPILAERLWGSIGHFASPEIEKAWMDEADRRWLEIEEGKVQCLPADEVMQRARQSLREQGRGE